ncbi:glycosyltransferase [Paracoccus contaminans]|uniref:Glycosyltransferase 2-like domain-containing protein n=1 Tax=Paracoccus contaminans TaxID=1945662 RepID=A0A1W6CWP4_9RHOB|nr:glycosyltransferase [Paracoccus contaminans]ARJ69298.1 hypothetical protein B0A89_06310 [Paracoccus contaminans]
MTGPIPSYRAFRSRHGAQRAQRRRLAAPGLASAGFLERQMILGNRLRLEGWAIADAVSVVDAEGAELARTAPLLPRPDVRRQIGGKADGYGFAVVVPADAAAAIVLHRGGAAIRTPLAQGGCVAGLKAEAALLRDYLRSAAAAAPDLTRWLVARDPAARHRLQSRFGTQEEAVPLLCPDALAGQGWPAGIAPDPVTIILPVYQGHDLLDGVLARVAEHTDLPWHLVVLDDASPDPRILPLLHRWRARLGEGRMTLIANPQNLGFVGSVNRGLQVAAARGGDVVLLNADAFVPAGWASRLLAPLRAGRDVASVTPMSNEAEIANVPVICVPSAMQPGEADRLDAMAAGWNGPGAVAAAPTGVGFCMALCARALAQVPQFDPVFGLGYGEEVDWCQRTAAAGWRHLLTAGLFVEHRGGQSFGAAAKAERIAANGRIISARYPRFDAEVAGFIAADPLRTQRLALGLALAQMRAAGRGERLPVLIGHAWSGGARIYLDQRIAQALEAAGGAAVLRAMPHGAWQVELHTPAGITQGCIESADDILRLWPGAAGLHVVYSCAVGTPEPLEVPRLLLSLADRPDSRLEVTFNDFYPISPSYTLVGSDGAFRGVPGPDDPDPAHVFAQPGGAAIPLRDWRAAWDGAIARADQLTAFSPSSARIIAEAWPAARSRIVVRPHSLPALVPRLTPAAGGDTPVIGVLGNLNAPKGAAVIADLSAHLARSGEGRIVLLGALDDAYRLAPPSAVAGPYTMEDLPELVRRHGIDRWFFPSVWPETFSFVIHEMLLTGLPVASFDLGGQADAVRQAIAQGAGSARLLPLPPGPIDIPALARTLTGAPR